jgi:hypothetical protein
MSLDEYKRRVLKTFTTSGGLKVTVKPVTSPIMLLKLTKVFEEAGIKPDEPPKDPEGFWRTLEPVMRELFRECIIEPKLSNGDFDVLLFTDKIEIYMRILGDLTSFRPPPLPPTQKPSPSRGRAGEDVR